MIHDDEHVKQNSTNQYRSGLWCQQDLRTMDMCFHGKTFSSHGFSSIFITGFQWFSNVFNGFPWDSPSLEPLRFPSCPHVFSAHTASQASHPPCIGMHWIPSTHTSHTHRHDLHSASATDLTTSLVNAQADARVQQVLAAGPPQPMVIDDPEPLASNDQSTRLTPIWTTPSTISYPHLSTIDNPSAPTSSTAPVLTHTLYSALATLSHAHPWSSLTFVAALP